MYEQQDMSASAKMNQTGGIQKMQQTGVEGARSVETGHSALMRLGAH